LVEHGHGTLREISSLINWKLLTGKYGGRFQHVIDHASRFHAVQKYYMPDVTMMRYIFSEEDEQYLRKHGGVLNEGSLNNILLKRGGIECLEDDVVHIFTDCHYYEGIETTIARSLTHNKDIYLSGI